MIRTVHVGVGIKGEYNKDHLINFQIWCPYNTYYMDSKIIRSNGLWFGLSDGCAIGVSTEYGKGDEDKADCCICFFGCAGD